MAHTCCDIAPGHPALFERLVPGINHHPRSKAEWVKRHSALVRHADLRQPG